MYMHDAKFVSQRQKAHGVAPHEPSCAPPPPPHGGGLQRLKSLPWPRNLFGEHATLAELLALRAEVHPKSNLSCACGCGREHRQRLSRILPNPDGNGFDLTHFWSVACESKWMWTRRQLQHDGQNQGSATSTEDSCCQF
jgi:hypothetical protein